MAVKDVDYSKENSSLLEEKEKREFIIKSNIVKVLKKEGYVDGDVDTANHFFKHGKQRKLVGELAEMSGISFTEQNISNFISYTKPTCDYLAAICICEMFTVNVAAVLTREIENIESVYFERRADKDDKNFFKIKPLDDIHYFGKYYGYTYSSNSVNRDIERFTLTIKKSCGKVSAEYVFEDKNKITRTFFGTPQIIDKNKSVEIKLHNDNGDHLEISFAYKRYNTSDMYFRIGCIKTSSTTSGELISKNFILCKQQLHPTKANEYLPGLLKMTNGCFNVSKDVFEKLVNNDPDYKEFFENFRSYIIPNHSVFMIDEESVLNTLNRHSKEMQLKIISVLIRLKGRAVEPDFISYSASGNGQVLLAHYVREYLFEQNPELTEILLQ